MGLPVVASAVKGHTDLIAQDTPERLYPYGDGKRAAACIRAVMDGHTGHDTEERLSKDVAEKYALTHVLPIVMAEYTGEKIQKY